MAALVALAGVALTSGGEVQLPQMDYRKLGELVQHNRKVFSGDVSVDVDVLVEPDGTPSSCREVGGNGSETVRQAACEAFLKIGPMTPARLDGEPVHGLLSTGFALRGRPSGSASPATRYDMELDVGSLPENLAKNPTAFVVTAIGADGRLLRCKAKGKGDAQTRAACAALEQEAPLPVIKDASGVSVPYVRSYNVRFNIPKGPNP